MSRPPLFKFCALGLSLILLATNCLFAHKSETSMWDERRQALRNVSTNPQLAQLPLNFLQNDSANVFKQLPAIRSVPLQIEKSIPKQTASQLAPIFQSLSTTYGTIRKVLVPPHAKPNKVVVHIQDVHMNLEAQRNIGQTVQSLINNKQADLIALEGAFEPIDLTPFRTFPHQDTVRKVADYLLRENKISGPIHTAFVSGPVIPEIVGIDDKAHYDANVKSYQQSAPLIKKYKKELFKRQRNLAEEKKRTFNPKLLVFDEKVSAYRQGNLSIGVYVELLSKQSSVLSSEIKTFLEALRLEKNLNFSQVEMERSRLLSQLIAKLSKTQTTELINASVAYRTGVLRHTDFYAYLKNLCDENGVSLSHFPAMKDYLRYVLLSDQIDAEVLFDSIKKIEQTVYSSLIENPLEQSSVNESKKLYLTSKLLDFSLTKEEWKEYGNSQVKELSSFEAFYQEAEFRDEEMSKNLLAAMGRKDSQVTVLVTGGFHSIGIDQRLQAAGYTVLSFTPKITKVDAKSGSVYLSVFTQEKTPLEKLFEGDKLFLCPKQTESVALAAAGVTALSGNGDTTAIRNHLYPRQPVDKSEVTRNKNKTSAEHIDKETRAGLEVAVHVKLEEDRIVGITQTEPAEYKTIFRSQLRTLKDKASRLTAMAASFPFALPAEKGSSSSRLWTTVSEQCRLIFSGDFARVNLMTWIILGVVVILVLALAARAYEGIKARRFGKQIIEEPPSDARILNTDMTLDYGGLSRWTYERILIDLVQNHLPSDSGGHSVQISFVRPNGEIVPLEAMAGLQHEPGMALSISDDGIGYDSEHLSLFLTTKSGEQRGQFGEGLKIAIAAALKNGIEVGLCSRDWNARARVKSRTLNERRANEITTSQVYFEIYDQPPVKGSRTTLYNLSPELFEAATRLQTLVLPLDRGYQPLASVPKKGAIVRRSKEGKSMLYVKGLKIMDAPNRSANFFYPCLYDYNFHSLELGRDRDNLSSYDAGQIMNRIILEGINRNIAEEILRTVGVVYDRANKPGRGKTDLTDIDAIRLEYREKQPPSPEIWKAAFISVFGRNAILDSSSPYGPRNEASEQALRDGKVLVRLPSGLHGVLLTCGVPSDQSLYIEQAATIDTSISLDYRGQSWGPLRILLDAMQNHLGEDSKATKVAVQFAVSGNETQWHDISTVGSFPPDQVSALRITDNGVGYDVELLGIFWSTKKDDTEARGKYGEGLKMLAAACLREGMEIELASSNWRAKAVEEKKRIRILGPSKDGAEKEVPYLAFQVTRYREGSIPGASTTIRKLNMEFVQLAARLPELVLQMNPSYQPLSAVSKVGEIKSLQPELYVQGLLIPAMSWQSVPLILGYNFYNKDIIVSPDRNIVNVAQLQEPVATLLAQTKSVEAVATVIKRAFEKPNGHYVEFQDLSARRDFNETVWQKALAQVIGGKKIALTTLASMDPDTLIMLRYMGYEPTGVNSEIGATLHRMGVPYDYELIEAVYDFVEPSHLTLDETAMLALTKEVDAMVRQDLGIDFKEVPLRVFNSAKSKELGIELPTLGFYHTREKFIAFKRTQLADIESFLATYIEELSHQLSGAGDYTRELYNFTTRMFVRRIIDKFSREGVLKQKPGAINDAFNRGVMWLFGGRLGLAAVGFFEGALRQMGVYVAIPVILAGLVPKLLVTLGFLATAPALTPWYLIPLFVYTVVFVLYSYLYFDYRHLHKGVIGFTRGMKAGQKPTLHQRAIARDATDTAMSAFTGLILAVPGLVWLVLSPDPIVTWVGWFLIALGVVIGGTMHGIENHKSRGIWKADVSKPEPAETHVSEPDPAETAAKRQEAQARIVDLLLNGDQWPFEKEYLQGLDPLPYSRRARLPIKMAINVLKELNIPQTNREQVLADAIRVFISQVEAPIRLSVGGWREYPRQILFPSHSESTFQSPFIGTARFYWYPEPGSRGRADYPDKIEIYAKDGRIFFRQLRYTRHTERTDRGTRDHYSYNVVAEDQEVTPGISRPLSQGSKKTFRVDWDTTNNIPVLTLSDGAENLGMLVTLFVPKGARPGVLGEILPVEVNDEIAKSLMYELTQEIYASIDPSRESTSIDNRPQLPIYGTAFSEPGWNQFKFGSSLAVRLPPMVFHNGICYASYMPLDALPQPIAAAAYLTESLRPPRNQGAVGTTFGHMTQNLDQAAFPPNTFVHVPLKSVVETGRKFTFRYEGEVILTQGEQKWSIIKKSAEGRSWYEIAATINGQTSKPSRLHSGVITSISKSPLVVQVSVDALTQKITLFVDKTKPSDQDVVGEITFSSSYLRLKSALRVMKLRENDRGVPGALGSYVEYAQKYADQASGFKAVAYREAKIIYSISIAISLIILGVFVWLGLLTTAPPSSFRNLLPVLITIGLFVLAPYISRPYFTYLHKEKGILQLVFNAETRMFTYVSKKPFDNIPLSVFDEAGKRMSLSVWGLPFVMAALTVFWLAFSYGLTGRIVEFWVSLLVGGLLFGISVWLAFSPHAQENQKAELEQRSALIAGAYRDLQERVKSRNYIPSGWRENLDESLPPPTYPVNSRNLLNDDEIKRLLTIYERMSDHDYHMGGVELLIGDARKDNITIKKMGDLHEYLDAEQKFGERLYKDLKAARAVLGSERKIESDVVRYFDDVLEAMMNDALIIQREILDLRRIASYRPLESSDLLEALPIIWHCLDRLLTLELQFRDNLKKQSTLLGTSIAVQTSGHLITDQPLDVSKVIEDMRRLAVGVQFMCYLDSANLVKKQGPLASGLIVLQAKLIEQHLNRVKTVEELLEIIPEISLRRHIIDQLGTEFFKDRAGKIQALIDNVQGSTFREIKVSFPASSSIEEVASLCQMSGEKLIRQLEEKGFLVGSGPTSHLETHTALEPYFAGFARLAENEKATQITLHATYVSGQLDFRLRHNGSPVDKTADLVQQLERTSKQFGWELGVEGAQISIRFSHGFVPGVASGSGTGFTGAAEISRQIFGNDLHRIGTRETWWGGVVALLVLLFIGIATGQVHAPPFIESFSHLFPYLYGHWAAFLLYASILFLFSLAIHAWKGVVVRNPDGTPRAEPAKGWKEWKRILVASFILWASVMVPFVLVVPGLFVESDVARIFLSLSGFAGGVAISGFGHGWINSRQGNGRGLAYLPYSTSRLDRRGALVLLNAVLAGLFCLFNLDTGSNERRTPTLEVPKVLIEALRSLRHHDAEIRQKTIPRLLEIYKEYPRFGSLIVKEVTATTLVGDPNQTARDYSIILLKEIGSVEAVQSIGKVFSDKSYYIRYQGYMRLSSLSFGDRASIEAKRAAITLLVDSLSNKDAQNRSYATEALRPSPVPVDVLIAAVADTAGDKQGDLSAKFLKSPDVSLRRAAARALELIINPNSIQLLTQPRVGLNDSDSLVRAHASRAVGALAVPNSFLALRKTLKDKNPEVREAAYLSLASLLGKNIRVNDIQLVLRQGLTDSSAQVRAVGAQLLGKIITTESVKLLRAANQGVNDPDDRTAYSAFVSLLDLTDQLKLGLSDAEIYQAFRFMSYLEFADKLTKIVEEKPVLLPDLVKKASDNLRKQLTINREDFNLLLFAASREKDISRQTNYLLTLYAHASRESQRELKMAYFSSINSVIQMLEKKSIQQLEVVAPGIQKNVNQSLTIQSPSYDKIFDPKTNPNQELNFLLFVPESRDLYEEQFEEQGLREVGKEGQFTLYSGVIETKDTGGNTRATPIHVYLNTVPDTKNYERPMFSYMAGKKIHFKGRDHRIHGIFYAGHSGGGGTLEPQLRSAPQLGWAETEDVVVGFFSCNSAPSYLGPFKAAFPRTPVFTTRQMSYNTESVVGIWEVWKEMAARANFVTIEERLKRLDHHGDYLTPNNPDQEKYLGYSEASFRFIEAEKRVRYVAADLIILRDDQTFNFEGGIVNVVRISSHEKARMAVRDVEVNFAWNHFLKEYRSAIEPVGFENVDAPQAIIVSQDERVPNHYKLAINAMDCRNASQAHISSKAIYEAALFFAQKKKGRLDNFDRVRALQLAAYYLDSHGKSELWPAFLRRYGHAFVPLKLIVDTTDDSQDKKKRTPLLRDVFLRLGYKEEAHQLRFMDQADEQGLLVREGSNPQGSTGIESHLLRLVPSSHARGNWRSVPATLKDTYKAGRIFFILSGTFWLCLYSLMFIYTHPHSLWGNLLISIFALLAADSFVAASFKQIISRRFAPFWESGEHDDPEFVMHHENLMPQDVVWLLEGQQNISDEIALARTKALASTGWLARHGLNFPEWQAWWAGVHAHRKFNIKAWANGKKPLTKGADGSSKTTSEQEYLYYWTQFSLADSPELNEEALNGLYQCNLSRGVREGWAESSVDGWSQGSQLAWDKIKDTLTKKFPELLSFQQWCEKGKEDPQLRMALMRLVFLTEPKSQLDEHTLSSKLIVWTLKNHEHESTSVLMVAASQLASIKIPNEEKKTIAPALLALPDDLDAGTFARVFPALWEMKEYFENNQQKLRKKLIAWYENNSFIFLKRDKRKDFFSLLKQIAHPRKTRRARRNNEKLTAAFVKGLLSPLSVERRVILAGLILNAPNSLSFLNDHLTDGGVVFIQSGARLNFDSRLLTEVAQLGIKNKGPLGMFAIPVSRFLQVELEEFIRVGNASPVLVEELSHAFSLVSQENLLSLRSYLRTILDAGVELICYPTGTKDIPLPTHMQAGLLRRMLKAKPKLAMVIYTHHNSLLNISNVSRPPIKQVMNLKPLREELKDELTGRSVVTVLEERQKVLKPGFANEISETAKVDFVLPTNNAALAGETIDGIKRPYHPTFDMWLVRITGKRNGGNDDFKDNSPRKPPSAARPVRPKNVVLSSMLIAIGFGNVFVTPLQIFLVTTFIPVLLLVTNVWSFLIQIPFKWFGSVVFMLLPLLLIAPLTKWNRARLSAFLLAVVLFFTGSNELKGSPKLFGNHVPPNSQARVLSQLLPQTESIGVGELGSHLVTQGMNNLAHTGLEVWQIENPSEIDMLRKVLTAFNKNSGSTSEDSGMEEAFVLLPRTSALERELKKLKNEFPNFGIFVASSIGPNTEINYIAALNEALVQQQFVRIGLALTAGQATLSLFAVRDNWNPTGEVLFQGKSVLLRKPKVYLIDYIEGVIRAAEANNPYDIKQTLRILGSYRATKTAA